MRYLVSLSLVVLAFIANARQISSDEAIAAAQDFFNNSSVEQSCAPRAILALSLNTDQTEKSAPYYIFNASDNNGFVIISGDDRAKKILAYSDKGTFDVTNMPPQLSAMLDHFADRLSKLSGSTTDQSCTTPQFAVNDDSGVLLETADWGQGYPYNSQCPVIDGVQAPTGCVATAMAIVMKYHNWPENGRNKWEHKYNNVSTDFSKSYYNFDIYSNYYDDNVEMSSSISNLALLFKDLGTSVNMHYAKAESVAQQSDIGHVMMRFFRYSPDCRFLLRRDYDDMEWYNFISNELNSNRPIIYNAASAQSGHAFVIDGFKSDMYHINWGWDGMLNGYFSLSALNPSEKEEYPYDYDYSMTIGIGPDYGSQEFSEVWLDAGTDRGESWQPKWYQDAHIGKGMGIDCTDIISGEPFSLITEALHAPISFGGDVAIALMDKDNQIVTILKSFHVDDRSESPTIGSVPYINLLDEQKWDNLVYSGSVERGMYLQLVAKRDGSENWEMVNGTPETPAKLDVFNNQPTVLKDVISYHGISSDSDVVSFSSEIVRTGQIPYSSFNCSFGVAHLFINNNYKGTQDDFRYKQNVDSEDGDGFGQPLEDPVRYIDIYYTPQNQLLSKTLENVTPGTLASLLDDNDVMNLYRLKINGTISNEDILTLYNLNSLGELDLSNATIEGNELTEQLPFLRVLDLPETLNKISYANDYYHQHVFSIIHVPENVIDCGNVYARDFIVFDSPIPPNANYEPIQQDLEWYNRKVPAILIVPKGSKDKYAQHQIWKHFTDIIEMEADDFFNASFKVDGDFMYCAITNKIIALTNQFDIKTQAI